MIDEVLRPSWSRSSLVRSAAVVARVLPVFVRDAGLGEVVAEPPVAPVQAVIVLDAGVEQDAGQLAGAALTPLPARAVDRPAPARRRARPTPCP
jgi:hypothetical protein